MLLLQLIAAKQTEAEKAVTRTRLSEGTLRRLWGRGRITTEFVHEVEEWLFTAGWVLFFTGSTYAMINKRAVDAWVRISSKRMDMEIRDVRRGSFDFTELEPLLLSNTETLDEVEDRE